MATWQHLLAVSAALGWLVAVPVQAGDRPVVKAKKSQPGLLGNASNIDQGYLQEWYDMANQKWDQPEDICKPILLFLSGNKHAGSYQIRGIQAAEALHERWAAPCPTRYQELCPHVQSSSGDGCSCGEILNRSVLVHVKFECGALRQQLSAAHHVFDECDTEWHNRTTYSNWDGVIVAHDEQGTKAMERDAKRFWSIPHHSIVHCPMMPPPKKETWDQIPQRILSMGSGFNEAPRDVMRNWAASYSERTGRDVKVIWEREFSTTNFNDLGLCAIFHQLNVTLAVAWQQKLVPPDSYKPVERMVNPISLGIPVVLFQNHPGFQAAAEPMPQKVKKLIFAKRDDILGQKLEHLIENYKDMSLVRQASLEVAQDYSAQAVSLLYRGMYDELVNSRPHLHATKRKDDHPSKIKPGEHHPVPTVRNGKSDHVVKGFGIAKKSHAQKESKIKREKSRAQRQGSHSSHHSPSHVGHDHMRHSGHSQG